ncbi:cytochrome c family protein [Thalassospiraceae bacterium LMO-SO8]|jgi:cytochrome c|nr:cytochrome c family protein [Alphaproteobacteria bacterium LMO-S08]WND77304.1 cytochrome c family protein [Thalassospiraceae bacterium LMO-SO8]
MQFSRMEKLGFGVLVTAWVVWGTNKIGDTLVHANEPEKMGFEVAVADQGDAQDAAPKEAEKPVMELIATASADAGAKVFKKCTACHSAEAGAKHKIGPNLWGIVGHPQGKADGYTYSGVLAGLSGKWTMEELDKFLADPKGYAPGTKMTFRGIPKNSDRAALLVFLDSLK